MNNITELQINQWADTCSCRDKLPVLLRKLIVETTPDLVYYRFPGNEAVALHGFDGRVKNINSTLWVPKGNSIWEIGCSSNPKSKAESDYVKRTTSTPETIRKSAHFIFITPRRWNTKNDWIEEKARENQWLSVTAYDAVDLETWLENAPLTTVWMSEELGINSFGLITPEMWWLQWSSVTEPPLPLQLPSAGRHNEVMQLLNSLKDPNSRIIAVIGDDKKECIAFIVSTIMLDKKFNLLDKTVIVTSARAQFSCINNRLIIIIDIDDNNDPYFGDRSNYVIIRSYPRTGQVIENSIILPTIPPDKLLPQLVSMGLSSEDARSEMLKVGLSLPILRRRLSKDPAIRYPIWASGHVYINVLLPCVLAGAWCDDKNLSDRIFIELLGNIDSDSLESNINRILALNDSPLVKYGNITKVISPIDALFALGPIINKNDLEQFFELTCMVLSEKDPAFDLPNNKRFLANVIGKAHIYSSEFIMGLCETLCILSIFGDKICGDRLSTNISIHVDNLIKLLLMDADKERWFSLHKIFRFLAEASPHAFLDCLENDLRKSEPSIYVLFVPAKNGIYEECLRSDLLWALEILAWFKEFFLRIVIILCKLSELSINDNYSNKPIETLKSLFCEWLPGTVLNVVEKFTVLNQLSKSFRTQVIEICIYLLQSSTQQWAIENEKPKWRKIENIFQNQLDDSIILSRINASKLIMDLFPFNKNELIQIIDNFSRLHLDDAKRFYHNITEWSLEANEVDKCDILNHIRHQELQMVYSCVEKGYFDLLKGIRKNIKPTSIINQYRWLFDDFNPPLPELTKKYNFNERLYKLRIKYLSAFRRRAIMNIISQINLEQFVAFSLSVKYPSIISQTLLNNTQDISYIYKIIHLSLKYLDSSNLDSFITPLLAWIVHTDYTSFVNWVATKIDCNLHLHVIAKNLPGTVNGVRVAKSMTDKFLSTYWQNISIFNFEQTSHDEKKQIVYELLSIKRPRTAYQSLIYYDIKCVSADVWLSILKSITLGYEDHIALPDQYYLEKILSYLDISDNISINDIIYIEGCFIDILAPLGNVSGKRNLKIHIIMSATPKTFFDIIDRCIMNNIEDTLSTSKYTNIFYLILRSWDIVPGSDNYGNVDGKIFSLWIKEIKKLCISDKHNRMVQYFLGHLLGKFAYHQTPDNWLPQVILEFLDDIDNEKIRESFYCSLLNARGITTRQLYEGGIQENELSVKYLRLYDKYKLFFPRVAKLLLDISQDYKSTARYHDNTVTHLQRWGK